MADRILLQDLAFYGFHGARAEEKTLGQRFLVDLELFLDLAPAGRSDALRLTVDYAEAHRLVRERVEGESRDTLEALAEEVATALLDHFPSLEAVVVRIKKPAAPIRAAQFGMVAVEIERRRASDGG